MQQRVRALAVIETVHHDLIHDAVAHPRRRRVAGIVDRDLEIRSGAAHAALAAAGFVRRAQTQAAAVRAGGLKAVPVQAGRLADRHLHLIKALPVLCAQRPHREALLFSVPYAQVQALRLARSGNGHAKANLRPRRQCPQGEAIERVCGVMLKNHGDHSIQSFSSAGCCRGFVHSVTANGRVRQIACDLCVCPSQETTLLFYRTLQILTIPIFIRRAPIVHNFAPLGFCLCNIRAV